MMNIIFIDSDAKKKKFFFNKKPQKKHCKKMVFNVFLLFFTIQRREKIFQYFGVLILLFILYTA